MATIKTCQIIEHNGSIPSRLCVLKECNENNRWVCDRCIQDKKHLHGLSNQDHIKSQKDLCNYIQQLLSPDAKKQQIFLQQCITKLNEILQSTQILISEIEAQGKSLMNQYLLVTKLTHDFLSLDKLEVDKLVNKQTKQFNLNCEEVLENIFKQFQDLQQIYKKNQSIQYDERFNYQEYYKWIDKECISFLQISPNEQLMAYGGQDNKLTVFNLVKRYKTKEITFQDCVQCCTFSNDSLLIYCGDNYGYLYVYNIKQGYKEIYKMKLHEEYIKDIKLINNCKVITCSNDLSILITDIRNKIQLLKLEKAHEDWIYQVEYEPKNQVIISCSHDKSINFFSYKHGNYQIKQQNSHNEAVLQIQLIDNKILLSRSSQELRQWQIDYKNKKIKLIRKFTEIQQLQRFASLFNNNIIIKIYDNYLNILDSNHKIISQYQHGIDDFYTDLVSNQTNTMNYILILGKKQFKVLKRINASN